MTSREQFEAWWEGYKGKCKHPCDDVEYYAAKEAWQASRQALNIELTPACWITYYPDTDEEEWRPHSESGPESCARRIASEIGGYVIPVYHGKKEDAAGLRIKSE